ncbi:hypothetical protein SAMN04488144_12119 [Methylobacterium sp. 190mf]|nr:hypothetical protein SAMN04488144_12119 [Methylobacterium sp. 190mf]
MASRHEVFEVAEAEAAQLRERLARFVGASVA